MLTTMAGQLWGGCRETWQCIFGFNNAAIQMQTFPQGRHWDLVPVGKLSSRSRCSYATVLLHKSTKVCATNVPLQRRVCLALSPSLSPCSSVCLSNYVSCNFFFLLGHPHTVAYCNIAYVWCSVCLCACLRLSVNHLKIVFSFQLFIYCGTCSHSICHAAPEATAATT